MTHTNNSENNGTLPIEIQCENCRANTPETDARILSESRVCEDCFIDYGVTCENCNESFFDSDIEQLDNHSFCNDCYNERAINCSACNTVFDCESIHRISGCDCDSYCSAECYNDIEYECYECGYQDYRDYETVIDGELYCEDCASEVRFFDANKSTYYTEKKEHLDTLGFTIGFELETYADTNESNTGDCFVRDYFTTKYDGSLGSNGVEFVSVPTNNDNAFELANGISSFLINNNYSVNIDCGMHLHIGGEKLKNSENRQKVMIANLIFKDCLFNMLPASRQNNQYCEKNRLPLNSLLFTKKAQDNPEDFYKKYCCRYEYINFNAFDRHGTIENRAHQGTINSDKIINWIKINTRLFDFAINSSYEELVKLRGNAIEFKRLILVDEDLINYYEQRVKKFQNKTVRKRRSVYHGIKSTLKNFQPRTKTEIKKDSNGRDNLEVNVAFEWEIRYNIKATSKDLLPVFKKEFDKDFGNVKVNVDV